MLDVVCPLNGLINVLKMGGSIFGILTQKCKIFLVTVIGNRISSDLKKTWAKSNNQ